jgi:Fur family transcriptional regulator, ferric uptake regulator
MTKRSGAGAARRARPRRGGVLARPADLEARFRALGFKRSAIREAVIDAFFGSRGHVSVEELTERARAASPSVSHATVYRTMRLLVENGLAAERDFGGSRARFEPAHRGHHDHLICNVCGLVSEFEHPVIEELQARVARELGFVIDSHKLELYGRCAECRKADGAAAPRSREGAARRT